jgi:hypothetical protein
MTPPDVRVRAVAVCLRTFGYLLIRLTNCSLKGYFFGSKFAAQRIVLWSIAGGGKDSMIIQSVGLLATIREKVLRREYELSKHAVD